MSGDYEHLSSGWRELCELLADIRDELRAMNEPGEDVPVVLS